MLRFVMMSDANDGHGTQTSSCARLQKTASFLALLSMLQRTSFTGAPYVPTAIYPSFVPNSAGVVEYEGRLCPIFLPCPIKVACSSRSSLPRIYKRPARPGNRVC